MNEQTVELLESIRTHIEEGQDPADIAKGMINSADFVVDGIKMSLAKIDKAVKKAQREQKGLERAGAGSTEAPTLLKGIHKEIKYLHGKLEDALKAMAKAGVR